MAAKTKTKHQSHRKWTSVTIFSVSVASLVLYLWHKIIAAIFCYFAKNVRSKNKKVKNNKKAKETKKKYDGKEKNKLAVKDEHLEVTGCYGCLHLGCYGSKKYLFGWLTGLMMAAFLLSIPWEFVRLYQSMVAEKVTHISIGVPVECVPTQMTMLETIRSWCRWQLSWTPDPCLQYHKALLIDPLWQVPPLMVLSSAFSHCIIYPIEILFGGLGRAFRAFFTEIPSLWQPVMLVIIVIFLLLTLVMLFGYGIHLPMLLKIEPKTPVYLHVKERVKPREIEKGKQKLNMSIEASPDPEVCSSQETQYTQDTQ